MKIRNRVGPAAAALLLLAALPAIARGQRVKVWVSSNAGDRMTPKDDREFRDAKAGSVAKSDFSIDTALKYQRIDGFGASIIKLD